MQEQCDIIHAIGTLGHLINGQGIAINAVSAEVINSVNVKLLELIAAIKV